MRTIHVTSSLALAVLGALAVAAAAPPQATQGPPVLRYRVVHVVEGRRDEASQLWGRFGSHFLSHYGDVTWSTERGLAFRAFSPLGDFARADRALNELEADEGWQALREQAKGVFVDDRTVLLFFLGGRPFEPGEGPRILRTTRSPHSKLPLARAFAVRVADHLNSRYEGIGVSVYTAAVHDPQAIHWLFDYADHAAFESIQTSLVEDGAYLELYQGAAGLFLDEETFEARID
jgi:hypothetical protein